MPITTIEAALLGALNRVAPVSSRVVGAAETAPPLLAAAMRHAVLPGGARVRPRLALRVAAACGAPQAPLAVAAAVAVELLHCASLAHDDLPIFDDAPMRRGRPSVHAAYGEPLALLAGDALIVLAFEELGRAASPRLPAVLAAVARGVGAGGGIVAGQAWESEPCVDLAAYHRAKTGALFEAAAAAGAAAAGDDPDAWRPLGVRLGEAWQVADDLADLLGTEAALGKPVGRDRALGRPNAAADLGVDEAAERWLRLVRAAVDAVPPCTGREELRAWIARSTKSGRVAVTATAGALRA